MMTPIHSPASAKGFSKRLARAVAAGTAIGLACAAQAGNGPLANPTPVTISYNATISIKATAWTNTVSLPKFDPSYGTLLAGTWTVDTTFRSDSRLENLDIVPHVAVIHGATGTITVWNPNAVALSTAILSVKFTNNLAGFDGLTDFGGPIGGASGVSAARRTATATASAPDLSTLAWCTGNDTLHLPVTALASGFAIGPLNFVQQIRPDAGTTITVTYTYLPAPTGAGIGDLVWNDLNGNGVRDAGEPGLPGVNVSLFDVQGNPVDGFAPTTTDASGHYSFDGVPAGDYLVVADSPAGFVETYDLDGADAAHSAAVSVSNGDDRQDVDFGFAQPTGGIGDRVWSDDNGNGVQDTDETGISGVAIQLIAADGSTVLANTTTDFNGSYGFSGLTAGTYTVKVGGVPAGFVPSYDADGIATANRATVALAAGVSLDTVDFGYQPLNAAFSGIVWQDHNRDGVKNATESRLPGVAVRLMDASGTTVLSSTSTAADGSYSFAGLAAGAYLAVVDAPAGYSPTFDRDGTGTPNQSQIALAASVDVTDVDFGYTGGSLGDRVWNDVNGNGVQDPDEPGIPGATVKLANGTTTTTDSNGFYGFSDLPAGSYTVTVTVPAGWVATSDVDGVATPGKAIVSVTAGVDRSDVDFGFQERDASIGDRVWRDDNGNGVQDGGEPGLAGVAVTLFNAAGTQVLGNAVTDANGYYGFANLAAGSYIVTAVQPAHHVPTFDADGPATPNTATLALAAGQARNDIDFGFEPLGTIGSLVWFDLDSNGLADTGEPGLSGITVTASGTGGVFTTVTDADGFYSLPNLPPGTYTVAVTVPPGLSPTYDADGIATPNVAVVTLAPAADRLDVDFGYSLGGFLADAQIGGLVWLDANANTTQDGGEHGIASVPVTALDANNVAVGSVNTDSAGHYSFAGLLGGTYTVVVAPPNGVVATYDYDGFGTPDRAVVVVGDGEHVNGIDFGYRVPPPLKARVAGVVWNDADGNRYANNGETGLPGITVTLGNAGGTVATATTDPSGAYAFLDIPAGAYVVAVAPPTYWGPTFDIDGIGTANTAGLSVAAGQNRTGVDFGYQYSPPPGSIGDRVWNDANNNGVQDAGEAGVANVVVAIKDSTGQTLASVATDSNGYYGFQSVSAGTYRISIAAPQYWDATADLDGVATPNTSLVTIQIGQDRTDVDFGLQYNPPPALIGDLVWNDKNSNGVQDAGEAGLGNVAVTLVDTANHVVATTTTDAAGKYEFPALSAGSYTVKIVAPQYYIPTYDLDGFATPNKASLAVAIGETNRLADFGLIYAPPLGSIGQYVWSDLNSNGVRDPGEPGVQGVAVTLRDAHNAVLAATTTDSDGSYAFSGLRAQTYSVTVAPPQGATATFDLDGVATPNVASVPLAIGQDRADANFGYHLYVAPPLGSIGDLVWVDSNNNGVQDGSESGLTNAVVTLRNGLNAVVGTATTDATGRYSFASLPADTYTVTVVPPANFFPTFDVDGIISPNTATLTLPSGANRTDVDFGYVYIAPAPSVATIGDTVWADGNHNGLRDAGEPGLAYVAVSLRNAANTVIAVTTTDSSGTYHFANVAAGNYSVVVTPPDGSVPTYDIDGIGTANVASFVVAAGVNRGDIDFGYLPPQLATIGDRVWVDANSNGIQEAAEVGLTGVPVVLYNSSNTQVAATTTGANGSYLFPNLVAGTYRVAVTPPANYGPTFDADSITTPNTATVTVAWGESRLNVDFGYVYTPGTGRIGDLVWIDKNGNGARDTGETGLPNAAVKLYNRTTGALLATTATDSNGAYLFPGLPAGSYTVTVTPPAGYTATYDLDGVLTPDTTVVVLASGQARLDADFGYMITPSGKGVGASPGFWSHNGLSSVTPADLAVLSALRLVNDDGTDADFVNPTTGAYGGAYGANYLAARTAFGAFEAKATAVNMASQLSRQLAAFVLDMRHGEFSPTKLMPCPAAPGGSCTAQAMIDLANAALIANPVTTSSNAASAYEESIKNSLESGYMTFGTP